MTKMHIDSKQLHVPYEHGVQTHGVHVQASVSPKLRTAQKYKDNLNLKLSGFV